MESGFLAGWVMSLLDSDAPPLVNSISYGIPESELPLTLMTRLNNQFAILGQRGVTIISTSGDLGSSDGTTDCVSDEPDYPSSSPYTTSLGASYVYTAVDTPFCQCAYLFPRKLSMHSVLTLPISWQPDVWHACPVRRHCGAALCC